MEQIEVVKSGLMTSRIGPGTWAIGGWMWGGTENSCRNRSRPRR
jgi:aryl-alcohol dehydrogenase-like predicted oxidoreductase